MSDLRAHLDDYLGLRRNLGFKLKWQGTALAGLVTYLEAGGATTITADAAIAWAGLSVDAQPITRAQRLGAARGFATYLATIDPATEVPPSGVFGSGQVRRAPYLWSETDIETLVAGARRLDPPLVGATYQALFGLLAVSGLRISEALAVDRDDVDLTDGVITVTETKHARSRLVPLHSSATTALSSYAQVRDELCPTADRRAFFVSVKGHRLYYNRVRTVFVALTTALGIRTDTVQPRIHDLRHSMAVRTLIDWHQAGVNIDTKMASLSAYLGHVRPEGTYWYLSGAPELMGLVAARLVNQCERMS